MIPPRALLGELLGSAMLLAMARSKLRGRKPIGPYAFVPGGIRALKLKPGPQAVAWEHIRPRPGFDTRTLDPRHVAALARSIAAVGLVQPPAVDTAGRLIAGGHRLAAWALLTLDPEQREVAFLTALTAYTPANLPPGTPDDQLPEAEALARELKGLDTAGMQAAHPDGQLPVIVFEADEARKRNTSLLREIAENEKRRGYTKAEVEGIAKRLKAAGFTDLKGRPEADQLALRAELARILGRSSRQIRRYLNDPAVRKRKGGRGVRLATVLVRLDALADGLENTLVKDRAAKAVVRASGELREAIAAYLASSSKT